MHTTQLNISTLIVKQLYLVKSQGLTVMHLRTSHCFVCYLFIELMLVFRFADMGAIDMSHYRNNQSHCISRQEPPLEQEESGMGVAYLQTIYFLFNATSCHILRLY